MTDPRKLKRLLRKGGALNPVRLALAKGSNAGYNERPGVNRYPPGRRHDEFERGYLKGEEAREGVSL